LWHQQETDMAKRHIFNDTALVMFMGGIMIPPGDGREIDEAFLPPADPLPAQPEPVVCGGEGDGSGTDGGPDAAALRANLVEQLKLPLKQLIPTLAEASDTTLAGLAQIEGEADTPRVTLLNAIGALQLQRADGRTLAKALTGAATGYGGAGGDGAPT